MSVTIGRKYTPFTCAKCGQPKESHSDQTEDPIDDAEADEMGVPRGSRVCMDCALGPVMEEIDKDDLPRKMTVKDVLFDEGEFRKRRIRG